MKCRNEIETVPRRTLLDKALLELLDHATQVQSEALETLVLLGLFALQQIALLALTTETADNIGRPVLVRTTAATEPADLLRHLAEHLLHALAVSVLEQTGLGAAGGARRGGRGVIVVRLARRQGLVVVLDALVDVLQHLAPATVELLNCGVNGCPTLAALSEALVDVLNLLSGHAVNNLVVRRLGVFRIGLVGVEDIRVDDHHKAALLALGLLRLLGDLDSLLLERSSGLADRVGRVDGAETQTRGVRGCTDRTQSMDGERSNQRER